MNTGDPSPGFHCSDLELVIGYTRPSRPVIVPPVRKTSMFLDRSKTHNTGVLRMLCIIHYSYVVAVIHVFGEGLKVFKYTECEAKLAPRIQNTHLGYMPHSRGFMSCLVPVQHQVSYLSFPRSRPRLSFVAKEHTSCP